MLVTSHATHDRQTIDQRHQYDKKEINFLGSWTEIRCAGSSYDEPMADALTSGNDLASIRAAAIALSPWAHIATIGSDNRPDVVPVHPCWEGDALWLMVGMDSVKAKNVRHNPHVALHWQVTEKGDGVEMWGTASLYDDLETKRRLWTGVFDYDLNLFAPGGPDNSPGAGFMRVDIYRALHLPMYGMSGRFEWHA